MSDDTYFPPSEGDGGWRRLTDPEAIRRLGAVPEKLEEFTSWMLAEIPGSYNAGIVVKNGWVVAEWANQNTPPGTTVEMKSACKALAALAVGMAIDDARQGAAPVEAPDRPPLDYDRPAYDYIPEGRPLSDPRKANSTIRQLIHHVAGIMPEGMGVSNFPPKDAGFWEWTLGMDPSYPAAPLYAAPGTRFMYGTYDIRHLPLVLRTATGIELDKFYRSRMLGPCGIRDWRMDVHGGEGRIGPHTDIRLYITARDFARIGYLMLRDGVWKGRRVLPAWLMKETMSQPFPGIAPDTFRYHWLHKPPTYPEVVPDDFYATFGAGQNFCVVVPSLDLVAARCGNHFNADEQIRRDMLVRLFAAMDGLPPPPADTSRPTVQVISPREGQTLTGEVEIRGTAADDDEVASVSVGFANGGIPATAEGTTEWRCAWDTRRLDDREYDLVVRAFDRAGNVSVPGEPLKVKISNGR